MTTDIGTMRSSSVRGALLVTLLALGCAESPLQPARFDVAGDASALTAPREGYEYTVIDVPGATWTQVLRANARGTLVGVFANATGTHGFVRHGAEFHVLDYPGAAATIARGINERGTIVGSYLLAGKSHGFVFDGQTYTTLDVPGANQTTVWDIAANGAIAGDYQAAAGQLARAFVYRDGVFEPIAIPGAAMSGGFGINLRGEVVGHYRLVDASQTSGMSKMFGFVWRDGELTQLNHPVPNGMSCSQGIGDQGAVVGHYSDLASGIVYGYLWQHGEFAATLRAPGALETYPTSITASGMIAGYFWDASSVRHGFVAEPLNPSGR